MKRNKALARKMRGGKSPYAKYGKRPCPECQQRTRQDRQAAMRGESQYQQATGETNG